MDLTRPSPADTRASDHLLWGAVHLDVTDAARSGAFWQQVIGLEPVALAEPGQAFGAGGQALVVLHPGAQGSRPGGHSGLYHLALHVPSEADFAAAITRAAREGWPQAPTDHITHWATYLDDPDGIQVELAFETMDRVTRYESGAGWPLIIDSEGRERHPVEALDVDGVMAHARAGLDEAPLAAGTVVGHLHLHVGDLQRAIAFYADELGMSPGVTGAGIGFADLSLGGTFPHRLAVNTWQRPGAPAPAGTPGMRHVDITWRDADVRDAALERLDRSGAVSVGPDGDAGIVDPDGNRLRAVAR